MQHRLKCLSSLRGISMYILQSSFLVTIGHMKYAHIQFDIIKITQHPEEGTIKVRWRINGVKLRQAVFGFIKVSWKANLGDQSRVIVKKYIQYACLLG